jgi:hypothetical protein
MGHGAGVWTMEAGFIAYKENTKLGCDSIGANQNGARKHHFCALFSQLNGPLNALASFDRRMV